MPSVIYVAISLPGFIRCPVDATPPVTLVKWKKDGLPLRIDKVGWWAYLAYFISQWNCHIFGRSFLFYFLQVIFWFSECFYDTYLSESIWLP